MLLSQVFQEPLISSGKKKKQSTVRITVLADFKSVSLCKPAVTND